MARIKLITPPPIDDDENLRELIPILRGNALHVTRDIISLLGPSSDFRLIALVPIIFSTQRYY